MLGQETEPRQQQDGEPELDLTTLPRYRVKSRCPSCGRPRTAGREVMRAVAETLRTDRSYAAAILEPIEIFGVDDFAESQVTNKARLKTCPLEQWRVGREYRRRLKKAFEAARIDIPFPHRSLQVGETSRPLEVLVRATAGPNSPE